ncbi:hypothetical protein Psuf_092560 [Phytohabitans suffuscus]|uniref:Uncharacterized protein n=1 Tax=Phytohabitans suffuscus TaxID=624315 RepID=A0A6F8Z119_9ACTN|nr:hypothetical protein Psuf_092560 [Phytohabitans suffuscus]
MSYRDLRRGPDRCSRSLTLRSPTTPTPTRPAPADPTQPAPADPTQPAPADPDPAGTRRAGTVRGPARPARGGVWRRVTGSGQTRDRGGGAGAGVEVMSHGW